MADHIKKRILLRSSAASTTDAIVLRPASVIIRDAYHQKIGARKFDRKYQNGKKTSLALNLSAH